MKLSEKLLLVAGWLEDSENDLVINAESDDACLDIVASVLVKAADALKVGSEEVSKLEPQSAITPESLDEMAALALAFDESGDELLVKQASVLDEILLTLAAPKGAIAAAKKIEDDRIEQLKKKYKDTKVQQDDLNKVSDAIKSIEKSDSFKEYRPLEAPLSSRYCPDHAGIPVARVGEHTWQCMLDKKIYNYDAGFETMKGIKVPGGGVELQTDNLNDQGQLIFDTRESRLGLGGDK